MMRILRWLTLDLKAEEGRRTGGGGLALGGAVGEGAGDQQVGHGHGPCYTIWCASACVRVGVWVFVCVSARAHVCVLRRPRHFNHAPNYQPE